MYKFKNMSLSIAKNELNNLFVDCLMKKGKKHTAEVLMLDVAKILRKDYKKNPFIVIAVALENTTPLIGFRNIRLRGSSYKIPYFLKEKERLKLTIGWFLEVARRSKSSTSKSLAKELIQASLKQGELIKKRDEIHKLGNQNKVFAHYRWF